MTRRDFNTATKRAAFARCNGVCEVHRMPPGVGDFPASCDRVAKELDHIMPDCLGGEPELENSAYLCREHHAMKTKSDQAMRKKRNAHRVRDDRPQKPKTVKRPIQSRGFQTNRNSEFKAKIGGGAERRS